MNVDRLPRCPLPGYRLRAAAPSDVDAILDMDRSHMKSEVEKHYRWDEQEARGIVLENLARARVVIFDGRMVGSYYWGIESSCVAVLHSIQVAEAHRNRGLGRWLMACFEAEALAVGLSRAGLTVFTDNPTRGLYEQLGYVVTLSDGPSATEMEKRLAAPEEAPSTHPSGGAPCAGQPSATSAERDPPGRRLAGPAASAQERVCPDHCCPRETMSMPQTDHYGAFAGDYHWLYSDRVLSGEPFVEENHSLAPGSKVLDCSCGIGIHALALARHGVSVCGADASPEMVKQARERAAAAGLDLSFTVAPWKDLPAAYGREFDVVFCHGNSIGHCRGESEMLASLAGMRDVLKDGGLLVLNSRNWEKLRKDRPRFQSMGVRTRNGIRCIPLYVWSFPEAWEEEHVIEVVLLFEQDGRVSHRSHRVCYYPFLHSQLIDRLQRVGFCNVESDHTEAGDAYTVSARLGQRGMI